MPIINAQAKVFRSWEGQLTACTAQAASLPNVEPLKNELQDILNQTRVVKSQQETTSAQRQGQTQELKALIKKGQETARRLRAYAKSQLGPNNEMLVQFGVAPTRPRGRKKSDTPTPADPTPPKAAA